MARLYHELTISPTVFPHVCVVCVRVCVCMCVCVCTIRSISVENHVSSYTHGGRPPSTGSGDRTSLLGRNSSSSTGLDIRRSSWRSTTMPSMRSVSGSQLDDVLGSPEIGRDSTLTRSPRAESPMSDRKQRKESNIENVKIQISPHVPEEVKGWCGTGAVCVFFEGGGWCGVVDGHGNGRSHT